MIEKPIRTIINNIVPTFVLQVHESQSIPFAIYSSSSGQRYDTLSGYVALTRFDFKIELFVDSYATLKTMSNAIIDALVAMRSVTLEGGYLVQQVTYTETSEAYVEELECYAAILNFEIFY